MRFWAERGARLPTSLPAGFAALAGFRFVADGLLAVVPTSGDAAVFDDAHVAAWAVLRRGGGLRALVVPAEAIRDNGSWSLANDAFHDDLAAQAPVLPRGAVRLTSLAARWLESAPQPLPHGEYAGPSGHRVPLVRVAMGRARRGAAERNPEIFGRPPRFVERPALAQAISDSMEAKVVCVVGGLGAGKSRLVSEVLERRGDGAVRVDLGSRRAGLRTDLAGQLLSQPALFAGQSRRDLAAERRCLSACRRDPRAFAERLALAIGPPRTRSRPLRLVIDGVEGASPEERAMLSRLAELPPLGPWLRLVLVGRPGDWEEAWGGAARILVPALTPAEIDALAAQIGRTIALPEPLRHRLAEAAAGNPFALEEAFLRLVHRGFVRSRFGNFFYTAGADVGYQPSARWVRHVRAEAERLGALEPLRLLAATGQPLPAAEAATLAAPAHPRWAELALDAGWLTPAASAWGPGVELASPAVSAALLETMPSGAADRLRTAMGESLAGREAHGERAWSLYRMLDGAPLARSVLLAAAELAPGERPRPELLDAFAVELSRLRQGRGAARDEFELLWRFLPLAHRLGSLPRFRAELSRAIELAHGEDDKIVALTALRAELEEADGSFDRAGASLRSALEAAVANESDADRKALLSIRLGRMLMREERFAPARQLFERILPFVEQSGRAQLAASCHFYLGNIALGQRRTGDAQRHHLAALEARRRRGGERSLGASLSALGAVALASGDYPAALERYREAQALAETAGRDSELAFVLIGLGRALARLGELAAAAAQLRRAVALREAGGDKHGEAVARLALGEALVQMDQLEAARREAKRAHFLLSMAAESRHLADAELLLGRLRLLQHQPAEAGRHFATARQSHLARGDDAAAATDLAWQLAEAVDRGSRTDVAARAEALETYLETHPYPELGERLDLCLFRAREWLRIAAPARSQAAAAVDPLRFLRRGYQALLRKTSHLAPAARHAFLLQVPENRDLLAAATRHGLASAAPASDHT